MAITTCAECAHQVSDKAASCPNCGAPAARAEKANAAPRRRGVLTRLLTTLLALWLIATTAWWLTTFRLSELVGSGGRLSRMGRTVSESAPAPLDADRRAAPVLPAPEPHPALRTVYQTTAEQLYRDYSANAVRTQSSIGNSQVRISGSILEIDEDAQGRPVVRLATGNDSSLGLRLGEDQQAAAAQLVKGETVEIQCDRMQRISESVQGSDCALAAVDAGSRQVYLAVFFANQAGTAPLYVLGPMPETMCLSQMDSISSQLGATMPAARVSFKSCTATTRDGIARDNCRQTTSASPLPDVPSAHLWRYDCGPLTVARVKVRKAAPAEPAPNETAATPAAAAAAAATVEPAPSEAAATPAGAAAATATVEPAPPSVRPSSETAAPSADAQTRPGPAPVEVALSQPAQPAPAPPSAAPPPAPDPDDVASVRQKDPEAADRIVSYCRGVAAVAADRAAASASCRQSEQEAWRRLVVQNEFPAFDEAMLRKCSEPPFPDSYVAKESCAKYRLHIN